MRRITPIVLVAILSWALLSPASHAQAIPTFAEHSWTGGAGTQNWQDGTNWNLGDFPNDDDPNDEVYPTANLSVDLAGSLNVNVGATPVTIAGLTLGGSTGVVTTEVSSGAGGQLVFRNDFVSDFSSPDNDADFDNDSAVRGWDFLIWQQNFGTTNPDAGTENNYNDHGDANADNDVDELDLPIWMEQYSFGADPLSGNNAFLVSGGVAGSINRITAPIHLEDEVVRVSAANPLTIDAGANITNSAADMESNASLDVLGGTVTVNSQVVMTNVNTAPMSGGTDLRLRATGDNATLILNGVVRDANPAEAGSITFGGGGGRVEIYGDNDLGGTVRTGGEILLGHDHALGVSSVAPNDPATVRPGGTFYSDNDARNIPNPMVLQANFNVAGDKTLTLSGEITQTNNRGFNNNIASPGMLILDGLLTIWEDDEALVREFDFLGSGTTMITGEVRDDPLNSGNDRRLSQRGPGVLIIDVGPGDNFHTGPTTIFDGNFHYANNDSLNVGPGRILSQGGAIGVDTGVAGNATFAGKIDPDSFGGLMLAPADAAANLDFTGVLANAARMTVAAPETGLTYTGTITPANSTYGLGGGAGTLTLPNAQLTGANSLEVRNGGGVELLGDNSYTGSTTVFHRPSNTTLVVDKLANGGVNSSIGASSSDASSLFIQGGVVQYVGAGDSTDRLFTIGTAGATIDSSGTGALVFSNSGLLGRDDAEERTGDVDDFTPGLSPDLLYNVEDITGAIPAFTHDIVPGMPVSDPDPGGFHFGNCVGAGGENCIPAGTVVTGVSADGTTIGISNSYPFVQKLDTRLVFGTVERTLTLAGSNAADNTLASVISDSPFGGVVAVDKVGSGKWILSGNNAYSGDTTVEDGILSLTSAFLDDASAVNLLTGSTLDLDFAGDDVIDSLLVDGMELADGIYGATDGGMGYNVLPELAGSGFLNVGGVPFALATVLAVPEPTAALLALIASLAMTQFRNRA
ncbi:autotransporter-associated beta strand repeat-containing protein [Pirellulales bacterium]|nr:autotransporter-associated beta strand repeat-containing protein [Pirellulales bacterium]